jgi:arylformamidase
MTTHTGTHIDAPLHFLDGGKNICQISIEAFIGPSLVIDVGGVDAITPDILAAHALRGEKKILFRSGNSSLWDKPRFQKVFTYLTASAAKYLVEIGVELVGIDYLSIEKFGPNNRDTHLTLLKAGVLVLEGLNLSRVTPGRYQLICLPLPIRNGDGAPCRAILLEE